MHCPFCQNSQTDLIKIKTMTFTHLDFGDFGENEQIIRCPEKHANSFEHTVNDIR